MANPRLAYVMVFTKAIEPMATFYENAFSLEREPSNAPGWLVLKSKTGAGIALHMLPPHIIDTIELTTPPRWRDDTAYKICFEVEDLDAQRQRVLDHGGHAKASWSSENTRFCECTDPEGNVVQILSADVEHR